MNKAIFWDLHGTLGGDAVAGIEEFEPYPFSAEALTMAKGNGFLNIVITNQSRIGKGELPLSVYERESVRILRCFNREHKLIEEILCCPHTGDDNCDCKKPKVGLIKKSAAKYDLEITQCYVIGDMGKNEIVMARNAGCKGVLVLTGGGRNSLGKFRQTWAEYEADIVAENALEAVRSIIQE